MNVAHANFDPVKRRIVVHTVWNEKDLLRAVPGARWDATDRVWVAPAAWATLVLLRGVLGQQLTLGERLVEWGWQLRRDRVDPALELRTRLEPDVDLTESLEVMRSWRT